MEDSELSLNSSFDSIKQAVNQYLSYAPIVNEANVLHSSAIETIQNLHSIQSSFPSIAKGFLEGISLQNLSQAYHDITNPSLLSASITPLLASIDSLSTFTHSQVYSALSALLFQFLSQWTAASNSNGSLKEINYSDNSKYFGRYTITKDERLHQTITRNGFGILYYTDNKDATQALIGEFRNDVFAKGMMLNTEFVCIGVFISRESNELFTGVMVNSSNELFIGTKIDSLAGSNSAYDGIIIDTYTTNPNVISIYHKRPDVNQIEQQPEQSPASTVSSLIIKRQSNANEYVVCLYFTEGSISFIYDSQKYLVLYDSSLNTYNAVFFILNDYSIYNGPVGYDSTAGKLEVDNKGIILYANSDVYFGNIVKHKRQGYGEYYSQEKGYYCKGQYFNDGFIEGEITKTDREVIAKGLFNPGCALQQGKITLSNKDAYEGAFNQEVKYNGKGQYNYNEVFTYNSLPLIISYDGYWLNGVKNGKGKLTIAPVDSSLPHEAFVVNFDKGELESID